MTCDDAADAVVHDRGREDRRDGLRHRGEDRLGRRHHRASRQDRDEADPRDVPEQPHDRHDQAAGGWAFQKESVEREEAELASPMDPTAQRRDCWASQVPDRQADAVSEPAEQARPVELPLLQARVPQPAQGGLVRCCRLR